MPRVTLPAKARKRKGVLAPWGELNQGRGHHIEGKKRSEYMGKVVINTKYCKGCELCTGACVKKLLKIGSTFNMSGYYTVEYCGEDGACTGCALCAEMCPDVAIEVWK
ncbi:MAG TPA: hypothetical protein VLG72_06360 [Nitrospirota bacterium]|nr:hypothetical protein [Nitrospirota bacterium]